MCAEALLFRLDFYEFMADDPIRDPESERRRLHQLLIAKRSMGLTAAEEALLDDLDRLSEADADLQARIWSGLRPKHREAIDRVAGLLDRATYMESSRPKAIRVGEGRRSARIPASGQDDWAMRANALRAELGSRFLDPTASMEYRAARVRKWRQLERRSAGPADYSA
jgi:hypothetical protein